MAQNSHLISKMPERETGLPNTYDYAHYAFDRYKYLHIHKLRNNINLNSYVVCSKVV